MSLAIAQIDLLVSTAIATTLISGSLTVFNFANNLQSFPIGIFGIAFATAVFPTLAANAENAKKFVDSFSSTLRQILFFIIPSTVLLLVLRAQIIRVVLGSGQFNWEDTILTMETLGLFSISLFAQASIPLLVRMFYARQDSKKPFLIGLVSVTVDIILSILLSRKMGVAGLALSFSIANIINFVLLWVSLKIDLGDMDEYKILLSVAKFSAAALACGIVAQAMKSIIWPFIDMTKLWGVFTQGLLSGLAGIFIYIIVCWLLKSGELSNLVSSIRRRLPISKSDSVDQSEARGI
jgi:putative peptidoglycan lipid II flippase